MKRLFVFLGFAYLFSNASADVTLTGTFQKEQVTRPVPPSGWSEHGQVILRTRPYLTGTFPLSDPRKYQITIPKRTSVNLKFLLDPALPNSLGIPGYDIHSTRVITIYSEEAGSLGSAIATSHETDGQFSPRQGAGMDVELGAGVYWLQIYSYDSEFLDYTLQLTGDVELSDIPNASKYALEIKPKVIRAKEGKARIRVKAPWFGASGFQYYFKFQEKRSDTFVGTNGQTYDQQGNLVDPSAKIGKSKRLQPGKLNRLTIKVPRSYKRNTIYIAAIAQDGSESTQAIKRRVVQK